MALTLSFTFDNTIITCDQPPQELMGDQAEDLQAPSADSKAEVTMLKEELQLVLKKEREAQVSVHTPAPVHNHVVAFLLTQLMSLRSAEGAGRLAFIFGYSSGKHGWF